jgi:hypothetical protein
MTRAKIVLAVLGFLRPQDHPSPGMFETTFISFTHQFAISLSFLTNLLFFPYSSFFCSLPFDSYSLCVNEYGLMGYRFIWWTVLRCIFHPFTISISSELVSVPQILFDLEGSVESHFVYTPLLLKIYATENMHHLPAGTYAEFVLL